MSALETARADGRASLGADGKTVGTFVVERARPSLIRATATEAKEDKVRVAFARLGATPPKGALVHAS